MLALTLLLLVVAVAVVSLESLGWMGSIPTSFRFFVEEGGGSSCLKNGRQRER